MRRENNCGNGLSESRTVVHLTASTFFGGPERQMLGLGAAMPSPYKTAFLSFAEGGRCQAFLHQAQIRDLDAEPLIHDTPRLDKAIGELIGRLLRCRASALCCHGYKANVVGLIAARRLGIPTIAVSRGWTRESLKVRLYERVDRLTLRFMDCVVCISEGQADNVRRAGIAARKVVVIPNAVNVSRFAHPDPKSRSEILAYFLKPPGRVIAAAGRLSPEKGFDVLIRAAAIAIPKLPSTGFIIFGDGPFKQALAKQIASLGLQDRFILAGFRGDLDRLFPHFDLLTLSSHTEGLPNVILEAFAAGVPVVATAVGGTPELIDDGVNGYLVPAGDAEQLARRIEDVMSSDGLPESMGQRGKQKVLSQFTFEAQSQRYVELFERLLSHAGF